ncbi:MAG: protein kinase [Candidatus Riflebacteria bacterium]|nr:protein kinase [Candidatus Riflebacteria bacterium]
MSLSTNTTSHPRVGRPCPKCGERTAPGAQFCGTCGHRFHDLGQTLASAPKLHLGGPPPAPAPVSAPAPAVHETARPAQTVPAPQVRDLPQGPLGQLPRMLGKYRVDSVIGAGGMGCVYRAVDVSLSRTVAIKTLTPEGAGDPQARQRFEREARTIAALDHPNITAIYFLEAEGDLPYYAMEFVEGESLEDRIRREGRLTPIDCCRMLAQAVKALSAAAAAGVVHRDIKPSNLLLRARDGVLKVTDFGLAKPQADKALTGAQVVVGTPLYMSPEQAMGKPLDFRSDLYSLGVTFYHALAGHPPYDDASAVAVMLKHLKDPLPSLMLEVPETPPALAELIERMLAKEPDGRHASYDEFVGALAAVAGTFRKAPELMSGRRSALQPPVGPTPSSGVRAGAKAPTHSPANNLPVPVPRGPAHPVPTESGSAQVPALPADSPAFFGRSWVVLTHPWGFYRQLPSQERLGVAAGHYTLVALVAGVETGLMHGHAIVYVGMLTFLMLLLTVLGTPVLKLVKKGSRFQDMLRISCYACTPVIVGGALFTPLNSLYTLILLALGVAAQRGK